MADAVAQQLTDIAILVRGTEQDRSDAVKALRALAENLRKRGDNQTVAGTLVRSRSGVMVFECIETGHRPTSGFYMRLARRFHYICPDCLISIPIKTISHSQDSSIHRVKLRPCRKCGMVWTGPTIEELREIGGIEDEIHRGNGRERSQVEYGQL